MELSEVKYRDDLADLINSMDLKAGAELGVRHGIFAEHLLTNTNIYLYCIDIWKQLPDYKDVANDPDNVQEMIYRETLAKLARYPGRYKVIRKLTTDAVLEFQDNQLDFLHIDANHSYGPALRDMQDWVPRVKTGGLITGHDYIDGETHGCDFGVISAVTEFFKDKPHTLYTTSERECWGTWMLVKEW
jgi:hypothetical protein